ncbi:NAD(P)-binding domain-containing protein [Megasphaera sp.]|uniref:NAD(P)-binding domain-containing protein n=1 Tax=Megasphaera sp. TaxID=2023260 RepID=UPI003F7D4F57
MALHDIGVVGMAVMGSNLALNMADHGYDVSVYNYTPDLTEQFLQERPHEKITGYFELKDFLASLKRPRKVMLMIMAGAPVDSMLDQLLPLLDTGDIIIDGGNSYFGDTRRRYDRCREDGIHFYGMGISGGETGARRGPAIMPGGNKETYPEIQPIYEAIAAKAADGKPCCTYIGEDGAGHYVKMVHNGIEYADMQLIAEAYLLLKYVGGYDNAAISKIFHEWNQGELKSFLIGIAADIFAEDDEAGGQVLDRSSTLPVRRGQAAGRVSSR